MKQRVGIPRAMGYYYLYPFFKTLLTELGAEPVLSPATTKKILERMEVCPTDEPCLAVKLFFSHADALAERNDIDFLFMPVIAQVEKTWCCPKFIGVSDMTRNGLNLPDARVLMPVLDYSDNDHAMLQSLTPLAERLDVPDRQQLLRAIRQARASQQRYRDLCVSRQLTTPEAYAALEQAGMPAPAQATDGQTIAVIGHPYLLYEIVSLGMIDRLRAAGRVITAEMVAATDIAREIDTIEEGPRLWPFEGMLLGSALHLLRRRAVDKIILVGSFECGPESIIEAYIDEEAERQGIPLMVLALDEHSGEAGLVTRLESFLDTDKIPGHTPPADLPTPHVLGHQEIVLGFPSMGNLDLAVRKMVEQFGTRTVKTPRSTQTCIQLGREIAPEFVCFPFTATLGQMRYMLDQGANTLLMVGGKGYCRLGWYAQVQERLLRNLGYEFEMLTLDTPLPLKTKWPPFRELFKQLTGNASWPRIISAIYMGYQLMAAMDRAEELAHRLRAFERQQGTINKVLDRFVRKLPQTDGVSAIRKLEHEFLAEAATIETEDTQPVHVGSTGEIWVVLEQAVTRDIERWLGARNHPRVWVHREHSASSWFRLHVLRAPADMRREHAIVQAAKPWLSQWVGGHGQISVGHLALARQVGWDGMIHIFPFTCMPEIIAQNIIVNMAEKLDMPVLTYIVSEQTGEAGMETRLESFLDLLEERRLAEQYAHGPVLVSGGG